MSSLPPVIPGPMRHVAAHRGALILVFGILSLTVCQIFGIFAWVMGNSDLRQMDAGLMDPTGRGITQAGKICGIIGTVLLCISLMLVLFYFLIMIVFVGVGVAGAAGSSGSAPATP